MTLEDFKNSIEQRTVGNQLVIFLYEDVSFVADQYVREICKIKGQKIQYLESIDSLATGVADIFGTVAADDSIRVFRTKEVESLPDNLKYETDLYLIVNKVKNKETLSLYSEYIINIPKLEGWQIKDYMYSVAEGVDHKSLDWLISASGEDIYRLENELDKLRLFSANEQKHLFNDMLHDGAFAAM